MTFDPFISHQRLHSDGKRRIIASMLEQLGALYWPLWHVILACSDKAQKINVPSLNTTQRGIGSKPPCFILTLWWQLVTSGFRRLFSTRILTKSICPTTSSSVQYVTWLFSPQSFFKTGINVGNRPNHSVRMWFELFPAIPHWHLYLLVGYVPVTSACTSHWVWVCVVDIASHE